MVEAVRPGDRHQAREHCFGKNERIICSLEMQLVQFHPLGANVQDLAVRELWKGIACYGTKDRAELSLV